MKKTKILIGNMRVTGTSTRSTKSKKCNPCTIILMATVLAEHQVTGSINFPDDVPGIITVAKNIYAKSLTSGIVFPATTLADYNTAVGAYETSVTDTRPGFFKSMNNKAQFILSIVQNAANAAPAKSILILHSCGFNVIPAHGAHVAEFGGQCGTVKGSVDLITAGGPQSTDHLHLWWVSLDGLTWNIWMATNGRKVTLTGFAHGEDYFLKTQLSIKDVLQKESNIITLLVN